MELVCFSSGIAVASNSQRTTTQRRRAAMADNKVALVRSRCHLGYQSTWVKV